MKNLEHLATFERGSESCAQYGGTISMAAIKKLKSPEIRIVLIPLREMPTAMADLMDQDANHPDNLIMFAAPASATSPSRKKPGIVKTTE